MNGPRNIPTTCKFSESDLEKISAAGNKLWPRAPMTRSTLIRELTMMKVSEILAGWRPENHSVKNKRKTKKH